eukprot:CCRYP_012017-RA/>CCRYP_012017-RA protein AED:0.23 eAED:0.23 QI:0/0/0/0.75/0.33/0.25/4/0/1155
MEFEPLADLFDLVTINTSTTREHVGEIERGIRLLKERARSTIAEFPKDMILPQKFIIHLMSFVVFWLNATPVTNGISTLLSLREIVTQQKVDFQRHCRVPFGAYIEASKDAMITNTMRPRTHGCIELGPSGNLQGSVKCFDLKTGMVVKRCTVAELPMPDAVIRKISFWGKKSKQAQFPDKLQFLSRMKETFDWDGDEAEFNEALVEPPAHPAIPAKFPGVLYEDDDIHNAVVTPDSEPDEAAANANLNSIPDIEITGVELRNAVDPLHVTDNEQDSDDKEIIIAADQYDPHNHEPKTFDFTGDDTNVDEADDDGDNTIHGAGALGEANDVYEGEDGLLTWTAMRKIKSPNRLTDTCEGCAEPTVIDYKNKAYKTTDGIIHLNPAVFETEPRPIYPEFTTHEPKKLSEKEATIRILGVIMLQQHGIKKGIKLFGEEGEKAVTKELTQLHDHVMYMPMHAHELTREQKKEALESLIFLTKMRCGRVKARACANGSKQRSYIRKENAASPTFGTDSVFITSVIEAHEGRHVVTLDIPGAFLHASMDEMVHMLLRGELAELMVKVDPVLYLPYITKNTRGEPIMFVKMQKAMYGMLRSSLLFYQKLVEDLEAFRFELNPYDPCIANKIVNGEQMTLTWHVDDLKVSHRDSFELTKFILYLVRIYGNQITVNRGKYHDYLGMDLDYLVAGKLRVSMIKYVDKILNEFSQAITKTSSTQAAEHLFQIRDPEEVEKQGKFLSEEYARHFHHTVAQLLFISTRARRDIQTVVAFLTTRVKKPDKDDWGKLKRVLQYLLGTKHMKLTLTIDNLNQVKRWVDASYNTHEDRKGQTGAMMSLGKGVVVSFSRKQKLNVRSLCKGELVGIDDVMSWIIWCKYFIEAQGYTIEQNVLYQDNKSTILLAMNGRWSSLKQTKHIKSRYFFLIEQGELDVQHMPTEIMWSDILTKPKQGKAFREMRGMLMNVPEEYDDVVERRHTPSYLLPIDEPVENQANKMTHPTSSMSPEQPVSILHHSRSVLKDEKRTDNNKTVTWKKELPTRGSERGDVDITSRRWREKVRKSFLSERDDGLECPPSSLLPPPSSLLPPPSSILPPPSSILPPPSSLLPPPPPSSLPSLLPPPSSPPPSSPPPSSLPPPPPSLLPPPSSLLLPPPSSLLPPPSSS